MLKFVAEGVAYHAVSIVIWPQASSLESQNLFSCCAKKWHLFQLVMSAIVKRVRSMKKRAKLWFKRFLN